MKRNIFAASAIVCILMTSACVSEDWQTTARDVLNTSLSSGAPAAGAGLTRDQIVLGLKEALSVGTATVVKNLGREGGFNLDPQIHIPLPATLARVDTALKAVGMGQMTADLETRMNQAAEQAVPQAKELFLNAIKKMTIADAQKILSAQEDAATQYLRQTMGSELAVKIQPIVNSTLARTGAMQAYDRVAGQYAALPFLSGVKTDLNNYVTQKAMDGIFHYVAQEEAAIRRDPAKRTTEILRTVFGSR